MKLPDAGPTRPSNSYDAIVRALASAEELAHSLESVVSRLCGDMAKEEKSGGIKGVGRGGMFGELEMRALAVSETIQQAHYALNRLSNELP